MVKFKRFTLQPIIWPGFFYKFCGFLKEILLLLGDFSTNVNQILVVDAAVAFFYILANFLSSCSICFDKGQFKIYNYMNLLLLLVLSVFACHILHIQIYILHVYIQNCFVFLVDDPFDLYVMSPSVSNNFLCSEVYILI